jgi:hypothetical protein
MLPLPIFSQTDFRNFFQHHSGIPQNAEFFFLKQKPTRAME